MTKLTLALHALNGARLTLIDAGRSADAERLALIADNIRVRMAHNAMDKELVARVAHMYQPTVEV